MIPPMSRLCSLSLGRGRACWLKPSVRGVSVSQGRAVTGAAVGTVEGEKPLKTFQDLSGPSLLTDLYWNFLRGYVLYSHELQFIYKKKYGPVWKSALGNITCVNIADVNMLETVLRQEGKYPMRTDMEFWKEHRRQRGFGFGPLTEEGQKWYTLRSVLNQKMLRPVEVKMYMGSVNEVVTDFLVTLDEMRTQTPSGNMVNEIQNALYRFAFEGISYILFETRIGCLDKKIPEATREFIDSIGVMFKNTVITGVLPSWTKNVLPYYKRYMESWDNIFAFGNKLIDQKMLKIKCRIEKGEEVRGEYLTYLISSGKLTKNEIYGSVAELLLAGVDTTSNTLSWALYHLAREPEIQKELYQEVIGVIPGQSLPSAEDISRMPLLRAVIKEILRLYPVIPTNSRFLVEKEITAGGYYLPKNTLVVLAHYAISRDETNFPEPNKFIPQRWIRENRTQNNPFSSIPFGYGVRACVGRRIAELEMYTCLSRIIKKYEVRPDPTGGEIKSMARIVLIPNKPINLQFLQRKPSYKESGSSSSQMN